MKRYRSSAEYRTLIKHTENQMCGIPNRREQAMERLKLEVEVACNKFWGNPNAPVDRPKSDPGAGGFAAFHRNFHFGKGMK